jgi:tetratricopeptide (TPR) repeat protein
MKPMPSLISRRGGVTFLKISLSFALFCIAAAIALPAQTRDESLHRCYGDDPDLAIGGCTTLIDLGHETASNLADIVATRGRSYLTKGEYDNAIRDFDQTLLLDHQGAGAQSGGVDTINSPAHIFNSRGSCYYQKGEYDRAIQDYDQALRINPNDADALSNRAVVYSAKGDHQQAIADESRLIDLQSDKPDADPLSSRCYERARIGQLQAALSDCTRSLSLQPSDGYTLYVRGSVSLKLKNPDASIADFNAALAIAPQHAPSLYGRGVAEQIKGDQAAANRDLAAAKALQPAIVSDYLKEWGIPASTP